MPIFSSRDRNSLESNPLIESVTESQIRFSPKFKLKALKLHKEKFRPGDIFLKLGVDPNLFLTDYPKKCLSRWKKIYEAYGEEGLREERRGKGATGRPKGEVLKDEKALRAKIAILEAEIDFLKKLKALDEKAEKKKNSR